MEKTQALEWKQSACFDEPFSLPYMGISCTFMGFWLFIMSVCSHIWVFMQMRVFRESVF